MNEWGIPDWRDAAAYPDAKGWTVNRWRWEFYRRRDDLREYFDARAEETFRHWQQYAGKDGFPAAHLRPDEPGFCALVDVEARERFGYSALPNPRIGEQPAGALRPYATDGGTRHRSGDGANGWRGTVGELLAEFEVTLTEEQAFLLGHTLNCIPVEIRRHEVAVCFDLDRPLQAQLTNARDMLKAHQEFCHGKALQKRRHDARWPGYLRVLDARDATPRASWAEITDAFFAEGLLDRRGDGAGGYCPPPPQAARDMWLAADALRFNF